MAVKQMELWMTSCLADVNYRCSVKKKYLCYFGIKSRDYFVVLFPVDIRKTPVPLRCYVCVNKCNVRLHCRSN